MKDRARFMRAMDELQAAMIMVPCAAAYAPKFTYIWTLGVARFPTELRKRVSRDTALREIARAFLTGAGLTIPGELARVTVTVGRGVEVHRAIGSLNAGPRRVSSGANEPIDLMTTSRPANEVRPDEAGPYALLGVSAALLLLAAPSAQRSDALGDRIDRFVNEDAAPARAQRRRRGDSTRAGAEAQGYGVANLDTTSPSPRRCSSRDRWGSSSPPPR